MSCKSLLATLAIAFTLAAAATETAEARPRPRRGKTFQANKDFGLGLELGGPTGLTGKYFLSDSGALQFGVGTLYRWGDRDGLHLYLDYLWHPVSLVSAAAFELPLYFGIGGRVWDYDYYRGPYDGDDGLLVGVHAPVGIAFDFNNVPLDIFVQLAFCIDFYNNYGPEDDIGLNINGSVGIRYWF